MGLLAELVRPDVRAYAAHDDYWFRPVGTASQTGIQINAETALQASAVWGCVRLIADTLAVMPIKVYRRRDDGGREEAPEHPLWDLLHYAPNPDMSAYVFKRLLMTHALLWGNAYARILPGPRGPVDQLIPLHPDQVRTERVPGPTVGQVRTYRTRYRVYDESGREEVVNDEDIFHLTTLSIDGINGLSLIQYARDSVGLALAAKGYSARFYSQNARPGGILSYPGTLKDDAKQRLREVWQEAHAGLGNSHKVAVLPEAVKWQQVGLSNEDAQLIESMNWSVEDIARYFNVPLHLVQHMVKSTSWGSGLEEMKDEFVTYTMLPWMTNWEGTIQKDLIVATRRYFVKLNAESLLRGKLKDRYDAYAVGRQWGWLSVNDILTIEDRNPIPNGDVYLEPLNMQEAGTARRSRPLPEPEPSRDALARGHYLLLLHEAASAVVRKEVAALSKAAKKHADDPAGWAAAVEEFYAEHVGFVQAKLRVPKAVAEEYCAEQRAALLAGGASVMEDWEIRRVGDLMALAQGGQDERADE
jgi:HK97 family phage portal protein